MNRDFFTLVALRLLLFFVVASSASCEQSTAPTTKAVNTRQQISRASDSTGVTKPPDSLEKRSLPPSGARVELRDCSCISIGDNTYELSAKYRFTQGHPDPNREYRLNFEIVGLAEMASKVFAGTQLEDEGELHLEHRMPEGTLRIGRPTSQVTMILSEEISRDGNRTNYSGISDEATGTFIDN